MISSDSRGRDREAGRKVTKVDLLLCPHCLSEETLKLCTVSSAVRDTILNDSHRKSNESSRVLLCNSWWRKLDSPKQTRQSFTWFSPHQYFRKSFISTLWKAVESEMGSLSPLVAVGGRTVITPVAEFCLEDLTWLNLMSATCLSVNHQLSDPLEKVMFESREWTVTGSVLQNIMIVNSDSVHIQVCLLPTWSWWRSGAWWSVIGWGSGTPGWTGGPARWRSERRRTTPRTWHTQNRRLRVRPLKF